MRRFNIRIVVANGFLRYSPILVWFISLPALLGDQPAQGLALACGAVLYGVAVWFLAWLFSPALIAWIEAGEPADDETPALARTSRGVALSTGSERS
jgi:hypothetical protein